MDELQKMLLTSAFTICGGILVLVAGQIAIRFILDPLTELRKLIGEIADALIYYAPVYSNPGSDQPKLREETKISLRQKASQLRAKAHALPWYGLLTLFRLVPSRKRIAASSANLIGLSNSVFRGNPSTNHKRVIEIRTALRLPKE